MKIAYGAHPITEQLGPLRKKRFMYAAAIVYKMNMIVREDIYPNDSQVIDSFLLNLSLSKNEEVVAEKLSQFFRETTVNAKLQTALELFNLLGDVDILQSTDNNIKELLSVRANQISERPRVKTAILVKSILKAMKDMFKQIEVAQLRNPLLDYSVLINKLNDLLDHYRALINTRATINKRKAAGLEAGKENDGPVEPKLPKEEGDVEF